MSDLRDSNNHKITDTSVFTNDKKKEKSGDDKTIKRNCDILSDEPLDMTQCSDIYDAIFNQGIAKNKVRNDHISLINNNINIDNQLEKDFDASANRSDIQSVDSVISTIDTSNHLIGLNKIKDGVIIRHDENNDIMHVTKKSLVHPHGYLKIIIGCMFSGKTSYIIRECKKWQSIGKNVLMINYAMDRRYSNKDLVVSHDKFSVDCMMVDKISDKLNDVVTEYDVVLINEGQFFSNLISSVKHWCDDLKKIVVVSGLDGDYLRGKFGEILDLIPDCDDLIKLKAYCSLCKNGTDAIFTWKIKDNPANPNKVLVDVSTTKYIPLCRKHYNDEKEKAIKTNKI
jgi:thymidine kinase